MTQYFGELMEGRWHIWHQGLTPLRYAAHLCGGWPVYGNPNDVFYSVEQILALTTDPWTAIEISAGLFMLAGYAGWYRCGRDILGFPKNWAHLFALCVTANGFYFMHIIVAHVNFLTFPLLGWLIWLLFHPGRDQNPRAFLTRAALFAGISGVCLYSGGYFVMLFFALAVCLLVPLDILCLSGRQAVGRLRTLLSRLLACTSVFLLIGASKIMAVYSLMRLYPRDEGSLWTMASGYSAFLLMFRSFWGLPSGPGLTQGSPWNFHEKSMFLSPVILAGLVLSLLLLWRCRKTLLGQGMRALILTLYGSAVLVFFLQVVRAEGFVITPLFSLPVLSSLRVTSRFLYVLSLLLTAAGIASLWRIVRIYFPSGERWVVTGATIVTVLAFYGAYSSAAGHADHDFYYPMYWHTEFAGTGYLDRPVETVIDAPADFRDSTTYGCYFDTVFLDAGEPEHRLLHKGAVTFVRQKHFNLINPSCYQYGKENACAPGDAIAVSDAENFNNFRSGKPVTWKLSLSQIIADRVTLTTLIFCVLWLGVEGIRNWRRRN